MSQTNELVKGVTASRVRRMAPSMFAGQATLLEAQNYRSDRAFTNFDMLKLPSEPTGIQDDRGLCQKGQYNTAPPLFRTPAK